VSLDLVPPLKVLMLQMTLHAQAKRSPNYRFYERWLDELAEDAYRFRLRQWPGRPERVQGPSRSRYSAIHLRSTYRLLQLAGRPRRLSCAKAWNLVREPDAGDPHVRFDEREVETGHGEDRRAPANERAGNCYASPKLPRHLSTLPFRRQGGEGIWRTGCEILCSPLDTPAEVNTRHETP
jgi:hypothetical protein